MAIVFAVRGDSLDARYSSSGKTPGIAERGSTDVAVAAASTEVGCIGNSFIDLSESSTSTSVKKGLLYVARDNWVDTRDFSILMRFAPNWSGVPPVNRGLLCIKAMNHYGGYFEVGFRTTGLFEMGAGNDSVTVLPFTAGAAAISLTAQTFYDVVFTFTGTSGEVWVNGSLHTVVSLSANLYTTGRNNDIPSAIYLGGSDTRLTTSDIKLNEFVIWNEYINPASVALENTTSASLNGSSRTSFVQVSAFDAQSSTNPGAANVLSGTSYVISGVTYTGSYSAGTYTDPGVGNVLSGTSYVFNSSTLTGTYSPATYSDPGIANVRSGTNYIYSNSTLTGTLTVPNAVDGTSSVINIPNIKEQVRFVLDTNNTTTSSVLDLSASMSKRVQKIATVNPEKIPLQASMYPNLCISTDQKSIEQKTIAKNQVDGKRRATLRFLVTGQVWNQNFGSNVFDDPADNDLERMMENTEKILRHYADLGGSATWQFPGQVTYHSANIDEQTHLRVAFMNLEVTVYY